MTTRVLRRRKGKLIEVDQQILLWRQKRKAKGVCAAKPVTKAPKAVFAEAPAEEYWEDQILARMNAMFKS